MNRQSLIVILIGAIATLSGFATVDYLRKQRCGDLQGIWTPALRECRLPSGETTGTMTIVSALIGLAIAAAVGFTLYRAYMYATGRARAAASARGR